MLDWTTYRTELKGRVGDFGKAAPTRFAAMSRWPAGRRRPGISTPARAN